MSLESDVCYLGVRALGEGYRQRRFSAAEVAGALLARIERLNPRLRAYLTVTADVALEQARAADRALAAGDARPLLGVPFALKDLFLTRGIRTTANSPVLWDWVPDEDATCTARLLHAGGVLLGKLAMHEFAYGVPIKDGPFANGRNPWDLERIPGGSSSGSGVAAAAGMATVTLGSDTGGSIRGPANLCGIVGLKPTHGRVSTYGVLPLSWSLDNAGPMCRTVEDTAITLGAIAGADPRDPQCSTRPVPDYTAGVEDGVRGLRVGVPNPDYLEGGPMTEEVASAVEAAVAVLAREGAQVREVRLPSRRRWQAIWNVVISEAFAYHQRRVQARPQDYGQGHRERLYLSSVYTAADFVCADRLRRRLVEGIAAQFRDVDVIVMPVDQALAATFEESAGPPPVNLSLRSVWNLVGYPALAVPCGFSRSGLPIGMQIIGRAFDEPTVFRAARAYERATDWHTRHPEL